MNTVLKASVAIAVFVALVSTALYLTGLHENPLVSGPGFLVLVIGATVAIVFWALKQSAGENGYGRQLGNAALIGLIGGVLVFAGSMLLLTVFPNYLEEVKTAQIAGLEQGNLPEERMEAQIAQIEAVTPVRSSLQGTVGTFFTCLIVGAIVAIFKRKKA
ncbi:MAG: DUF4199 family protein [Acidobacteria bacterium]|nr:DUF4199 family protein [Acidobacteriota bacterium]NIM61781.1 DUF4199 family protein [Acidobacteriota bacterium]NIO60025.1 DUF4199 family protein [Acidobacteriota bacterium]NIQ29217.1 DUF4199 family protein [Acidobacteriota bacterium]NIQ83791.1 DUF4199 family protein [Acidobacteriota bacterium]